MASSGTILVTGATGNVASILIPTLLQSGQRVRALVHDEAKAQGLRDQGAEVVVADMEKPETLDAAVAGVDKIYFLTSNSPNGGQHGINLIDAVKRSGGRPHIVRHGMFGDSRSRIFTIHERVEAALAESGLPVTTLRPTFFMQNTMAGAQTVASAGQLYWAMDDAKLAMIDIRDIAECAAAVLTSDGHVGDAYVLTGPQAVSFHDVALLHRGGNTLQCLEVAEPLLDIVGDDDRLAEDVPGLPGRLGLLSVSCCHGLILSITAHRRRASSPSVGTSC